MFTPEHVALVNRELCAIPVDVTDLDSNTKFAAGSELRVAVKVGDIDWYRTEFSIYKGNVFWRKHNIIDSWAKNVGSDYSVATTPGKKLYVNFDTNKAEVK